jgi:hypothetical protein
MRLSSSSLAVVAASATAFTCVVLWKSRRRTNGNDKKEEHNDDDDDSQQDFRTIQLPLHLERELMKEERRQQMIPLLTMKKVMYDNILMKDPDDMTLCTVSLKKATWYVKRNLAVWKDDKRKCIQLAFHPKQQKDAKSQQQQKYNQTPKENRCVVCGASKDYMRHYVVPYCYRSLFPAAFKTHLPHDVVLVCCRCHVRAERASHARKMQMEDALRSDPATAAAQTVDGRLQRIRSAATALLKWKEQLPPARIHEYQVLLQEYYYGMEGSAEQQLLLLTVEQLQAASEIESRLPNPKYVSGADLVVIELLQSNNDDNDNDQAIRDFVMEWRQHFVDTLQPQFLPAGWSVDSPVQCDIRGD